MPEEFQCLGVVKWEGFGEERPGARPRDRGPGQPQAWMLSRLMQASSIPSDSVYRLQLSIYFMF